MKQFLRSIVVCGVIGLIVGLFMAALTRSPHDDLVPTVAAAAGAIIGAIRYGIQEICDAIRDQKK